MIMSDDFQSVKYMEAPKCCGTIIYCSYNILNILYFAMITTSVRPSNTLRRMIDYWSSYRYSFMKTFYGDLLQRKDQLLPILLWSC